MGACFDKLVESAINDMKKHVLVLTEWTENTNFNANSRLTLQRSPHSLKSICNNLGADYLSDLSARCELHIQKEEMGQGLEMVKMITDEYTQSVMNLGVKFWFYFSPSTAKRR